MTERRIIFGKPKPKPKPKTKPKGQLIGRKPLSFGLKIKDECQHVSLPDEYQERAAKAFNDGTLSLLDGELLCKCGARVGARKSNLGSWFVPSRHSVFKPPRQPARKRGPRKTF
ncbi:MAG TPA: hypothetical protein VHX60_02985 [Acidobacteriaceae bacterium]|jgi:hypothetical protein|nr:hypothetical protein [Acidobacteriaceae bacterium]